MELKEQLREEAEEEHPAAGGLLCEPTIASRTDIVVHCNNLQENKAWTNTTNEILLSGVEEIMASNVAIPGKLEVLRDKEIWVADSGATSHCSKSAMGRNKCEANISSGARDYRPRLISREQDGLTVHYLR